jgi:hypothetical protein
MVNKSTILAIILAAAAGFASSALTANARSAHQAVNCSGLYSSTTTPANSQAVDSTNWAFR